MTSIHQAETDKGRALIRDLFWEYLEWANTRLNEEYGIDFDIKSMLEQDMAKPPASYQNGRAECRDRRKRVRCGMAKAG